MKKKYMKTIIAIVLALCVSFSMAACTGDTGTSASPPPAAPPANSDNDAAPAPAPAPSGEVLEWNLGTINSDPSVATDFNAWGHMCQNFADNVKEYTNGQIVITVHYGGVLGTGPQLFEQLEMGELEIYSGMATAGSDPRFAMLNVPYLFDSQEAFDKAIDGGNGEICQLINGWIAEHNIKVLGMGGGAPRGVATINKELVVPDDIKGLKMRVYEDPLVRAFWDNLTQTQILPSAEIYSSLQTGNIDALENHATVVSVLKFYEVCKYYTDIDWIREFTTTIMINQDKWDSLTPELQDAVSRAAQDAIATQKIEQADQTECAYAFLEEHGMKVTKLTPEQRQVWIDYSDTLKDTYRDIVGPETYDEFTAAIERSK